MHAPVLGLVLAASFVLVSGVPSQKPFIPRQFDFSIESKKQEMVNAMRERRGVTFGNVNEAPAFTAVNNQERARYRKRRLSAEDGLLVNGVCVDYTNDKHYDDPGNLKNSVPASTNGKTFITRPPTLSECELEQLHRDCVERINEYRTGQLKFSDGTSDPKVDASVQGSGTTIPVLDEMTGTNECSSSQALGDLKINVEQGDGCEGAHSTAGSCPGHNAQNACCARGGGAFGWMSSPIVTYDTIKETLFECLQDMWDEGSPSYTGTDIGHWQTMRNEQYTEVSCGFAWTEDGRVWMNQDFSRSGTSNPACSCYGKSPGQSDGCGGQCHGCQESEELVCEDNEYTAVLSSACSGPSSGGSYKSCTCNELYMFTNSPCEHPQLVSYGVKDDCKVTCGTCPEEHNTCPDITTTKTTTTKTTTTKTTMTTITEFEEDIRLPQPLPDDIPCFCVQQGRRKHQISTFRRR